MTRSPCVGICSLFKAQIIRSIAKPRFVGSPAVVRHVRLSATELWHRVIGGEEGDLGTCSCERIRPKVLVSLQKCAFAKLDWTEVVDVVSDDVELMANECSEQQFILGWFETSRILNLVD